MLIPIIRTNKLHRPPVDTEHLHRQHLLDRLNKRLHRPLTLISAPAGYGKSTLVSCWLEACDFPTAWLSIDETDNDLRLFLSYFLAAVQTVFPEVGQKIQAILRTKELPPLPVLILLDIMMPDIDGFEVRRRLKDNPDTASIPIISLSALTEDEKIKKRFESWGR
jgi:LuxR family maltose regulon positive regulatory protein